MRAVVVGADCGLFLFTVVVVVVSRVVALEDRIWMLVGGGVGEVVVEGLLSRDHVASLEVISSRLACLRERCEASKGVVLRVWMALEGRGRCITRICTNL